jgi:hypothetical protein
MAVLLQPHLSPAAKPRVYDTGYELFAPLVTPSMFWIDNDRLLFSGANSVDARAAVAAGNDPARVSRLRRLYLWIASTTSVKLYADATDVCVSNGTVRYTVSVDKAAGKAVLREGPFGSEKRVERLLPSKQELSAQGQLARVHSYFTCKTHLRSELVPPASKFRQIVVLREGDGYLDLGPSGGPNYAEERKAHPRNLTLYEGKTGRAIELPMTWEENFSPLEVSYSSYRAAYVLRPRAPPGAPIGVVQPWPKGKPLTAYLIWADGRSESVSIPYFHTFGLGSPRPVGVGWVFAGGYFDKAGLYLFDGKRMSRLDVGAAGDIAVSPNGCRAAVAIQNKHREMGTPTNLKIFDFCLNGQ